MYQHIEKAFDEIAKENVVKKRKSPLGSILFIIVGIAVAMADRFVPFVANSTDISAACVMVGWSLVLVGVVKIVIIYSGKSWNYYYKPSGERLKKHELTFENPHKEKVLNCVVSGQFDKLAAIPRSNVSSVKVVFYATAHDVLWAQVLEFVPHVHEPVTDVIVFEKGQCALPKELV